MIDCIQHSTCCACFVVAVQSENVIKKDNVENAAASDLKPIITDKEKIIVPPVQQLIKQQEKPPKAEKNAENSIGLKITSRNKDIVKSGYLNLISSFVICVDF